MVGKGTEEWRRALAEPEEEDAQQILQSLSNLNINNEHKEECVWDVFTEEILPRLSANQLQTLKSVCKNWNRIISSPYFAALHLKVYNNQSRIRVLMATNYRDWRKPEIIEYNINNSEIKRIPYPPEILERTPEILGSCNGLVCLHFEGWRRTIATYNPSTGKYFWVQSRLNNFYNIDCSWFGHHPSSGEYVLVLWNFGGEVGVYKFNRGSNLTMVHSTSCRINSFYGYGNNYVEGVGTLLHGALHWPLYHAISYGNAICAYHLDDNKHFEIAPPVQRGSSLHDFKLGVAEGCLFAFFRATNYNYDAGVFELWIMKEYKVHHSWTKYANIQAQGLKNRLAPLAFFPNANHLTLHPNELRLINNTFNDNKHPNSLGLINYTFNDNKALLLMNYEYSVEAMMCPDSLLSPKIVGT